MNELHFDGANADNAETDPFWQQMSPERQRAILEGVEAIRVHRDGLERVFTIGRAFHELQAEAMARSSSNKPSGRRYITAYAALEKPVPALASINKTDRSQYVWCYQNKEPLEAWWPLPENDRRRDKWNHPDAIKRNFKAYEKALAGETNKESKPSWAQKMSAAVAELTEQVDAVTRERDRAAARAAQLERELASARSRAREAEEMADANPATITQSDLHKLQKVVHPDSGQHATFEERNEAMRVLNDCEFHIIDGL